MLEDLSAVHFAASDRLASQHDLIAKTHAYASSNAICLLDEARLPTRVNRLLQNPAVSSAFVAQNIYNELRNIGRYEDLSTHAQSELERIIGGENFLPVWFLARGAELARTVARIRARNESGTEFFGTGFLIGPRLLITNFHVLDWTDMGRESIDTLSNFSKAEFDSEELPNGSLMKSRMFRLKPEQLLFYSGLDQLDYALVALAEQCMDGLVHIESYGYNRLAGDLGKIMKGEPAYIIQHPQGRAKQVVMQNNRLIDRSDESPYLSYEANTDYGSSGSPVFNRQWEVVALHHSAEIARSNGKILAKDNSLWQPHQGSSNIKFLDFNEGVRISKILNDIQQKIDRIEAGNPAEKTHEKFDKQGLALLKTALRTHIGAHPLDLIVPIPVAQVAPVGHFIHQYPPAD